jgi:hypothetical protein
MKLINPHGGTLVNRELPGIRTFEMDYSSSSATEVGVECPYRFGSRTDCGGCFFTAGRVS